MLGAGGVSLRQADFGASAGGSGSGESITFAPVITITGNADKGTMEQATQEMFAQFKRFYSQLKREEARKSFA